MLWDVLDTLQRSSDPDEKVALLRDLTGEDKKDTMWYLKVQLLDGVKGSSQLEEPFNGAGAYPEKGDLEKAFTSIVSIKQAVRSRGGSSFDPRAISGEAFTHSRQQSKWIVDLCNGLLRHGVSLEILLHAWPRTEPDAPLGEPTELQDALVTGSWYLESYHHGIRAYAVHNGVSWNVYDSNGALLRNLGHISHDLLNYYIPQDYMIDMTIVGTSGADPMIITDSLKPSPNSRDLIAIATDIVGRDRWTGRSDTTPLEERNFKLGLWLGTKASRKDLQPTVSKYIFMSKGYIVRDQESIVRCVKNLRHKGATKILGKAPKSFYPVGKTTEWILI